MSIMDGENSQWNGHPHHRGRQNDESDKRNLKAEVDTRNSDEERERRKKKLDRLTSATTRARRNAPSSMHTYYLDTVLKQHSFKNICIGQVLKTAV